MEYFPGWTRKSITFTMDDGNIPMDTKLLTILKPYGILGTFNLCAHRLHYMSPEEYREFYRGYEIANHCNEHPVAFPDGAKFVVSDDPFDPIESLEYTEENPIVYKTEVKGLYMMHHIPKRIRPDGWFRVAEARDYIRFVDEGKVALEEIFGVGKIKDYVWPCRRQENTEVLEYLKSAGYRSARRTDDNTDKTFAYPADRLDWTYNAHHSNLLSVMKEYEEYPDDGKLKFFAFGVHASDFHRDNNWHELQEFAEKYGNRPEDYYYSTVGGLFEYEDAKNSLVIEEDKITNPSEISLYIKVDGKRIIVRPHTSYKYS